MGLWDLDRMPAPMGPTDGRSSLPPVTAPSFGEHRDEQWRREDRFERLLLLSEAMWELAAPLLALTDDHLGAKMAEIDGRSGAVDGHRSRSARPCESCSAAVPPGRAACMFCGLTQSASPDPFDVV